MKFVNYYGEEITNLELPKHTHGLTDIVRKGKQKGVSYPNMIYYMTLSTDDIGVRADYTYSREDSREIIDVYLTNLSYGGYYNCKLLTDGFSIRPKTKYVVYIEYTSKTTADYSVEVTPYIRNYGDFKLYTMYNGSDQVPYIMTKIEEPLVNAESRFGKLYYLETSDEVYSLELDMGVNITSYSRGDITIARMYIRELEYYGEAIVPLIADEENDGFMEKSDKIKLNKLFQNSSL